MLIPTPKMLPAADVLARLETYLPEEPLPAEEVPLLDAAGRILVEELVAEEDSPRFANAAMDGFAFRYADVEGRGRVTLKVVGLATAGHPYESPVGEGEAVRIMTGAKLPEGLDTMIQFEKTEGDDEHVSFDSSLMSLNKNVRLPGELYFKGDVLVKSGTIVSEGVAALAAGMGRTTLKCRRRPVVGVFASGDELVEPGSVDVLPEGKIYNTNGITITMIARRLGADARYLGILPDDPEKSAALLREAVATHDILVSSGGVGPGVKDYTSTVLAELADVEHHRAMLRPGKAVVFGRFLSGRKGLFIGLSGNPLAAAQTARLYLKHAVDAHLGVDGAPALNRAVLAKPVKSKEGRIDLVGGSLSTDDEGRLVLTPARGQNSASPLGIANSPATAILREDVGETHEGDLVELLYA